MEPLVKEILTDDEVMEMYKMTQVGSSEWSNDNWLSISKGWFETWDGEKHTGYIVCHYYKEVTPETSNRMLKMYHETYDYFFMEVSKTFIKKTVNGYYNKNNFHRLIPLTLPRVKRLNGAFDMTDLCDYIISKCQRDNFGYDHELIEVNNGFYARKEKSVIPLSINDIGYVYDPLTEEDKREFRRQEEERERELLSHFSSSKELPPAEDDMWYSILADCDSAGFGDYTLERKVIDILRRNGHSVRIVGERDSFGWVTRGIEVDGVIMAIV